MQVRKCRLVMSRPRATVPSCLVLDVAALPWLSGLDLQEQLARRAGTPITLHHRRWQCADDGAGDEAGAFDSPNEAARASLGRDAPPR